MTRSRTLALLALTLVLGMAACDRTPVDPQDPDSELAMLLGDGGAAGAAGRAPLSLPGLLHSAVDRVYREQGAAAARTLIMELRVLHLSVQRATLAGDREDAAARMHALHAEELRVVLSVFGDPVAARVAEAVRTDAQRLRARLTVLQQDGHALPRAAEALASVEELLVDAEAALAAGDARGALDAGTRAAALVDAVRRVLADAVRLPALEQVFDRAVSRLSEGGDPDRVRAALADYHRADAAARAAVRSGDREDAHAALEAVRREQIRVVLRVLGPGAVAHALQQARTASDELDSSLAAARSAGRDVSRLERMLASANDMLHRAELAFTSGDAAAALDLGSHAAGLLNAIRVAL
jgi:hypothetical protein